LKFPLALLSAVLTEAFVLIDGPQCPLGAQFQLAIWLLKLFNLIVWATLEGCNAHSHTRDHAVTVHAVIVHADVGSQRRSQSSSKMLDHHLCGRSGILLERSDLHLPSGQLVLHRRLEAHDVEKTQITSRTIERPPHLAAFLIRSADW
jgi:hypothetical protein